MLLTNSKQQPLDRQVNRNTGKHPRGALLVCECSGNAMKNQQGFVLILSLVILVGMSLISISLVKTSFVEEKMVGHELARHQTFESAEMSIRDQEVALSTMTDLSGLSPEQFLNDECGIVKVEGVSTALAGQNGWTIYTAYYVPPPNGFNWGDGDGSKIRLCHKDKNDLLVSINAVGDEHHGHMQHEGDHLGYCGEGNNGWNTCIDRFGSVPKRLSWIEYAE